MTVNTTSFEQNWGPESHSPDVSTLLTGIPEALHDDAVTLINEISATVTAYDEEPTLPPISALSSDEIARSYVNGQTNPVLMERAMAAIATTENVSSYDETLIEAVTLNGIERAITQFGDEAMKMMSGSHAQISETAKMLAGLSGSNHAQIIRITERRALQPEVIDMINRFDAMNVALGAMLEEGLWEQFITNERIKSKLDAYAAKLRPGQRLMLPFVEIKKDLVGDVSINPAGIVHKWAQDKGMIIHAEVIETDEQQTATVEDLFHGVRIPRSSPEPEKDPGGGSKYRRVAILGTVLVIGGLVAGSWFFGGDSSASAQGEDVPAEVGGAGGSGDVESVNSGGGDGGGAVQPDIAFPDRTETPLPTSLPPTEVLLGTAVATEDGGVVMVTEEEREVVDIFEVGSRYSEFIKEGPALEGTLSTYYYDSATGALYIGFPPEEMELEPFHFEGAGSNSIAALLRDVLSIEFNPEASHVAGRAGLFAKSGLGYPEALYGVKSLPRGLHFILYRPSGEGGDLVEGFEVDIADVELIRQYINDGYFWGIVYNTNSTSKSHSLGSPGVPDFDIPGLDS